MSVVGLMQIVFVMVLCTWAFDRRMNATALVGTALVIAPTAWLLTRSRATSDTEPAPGAENEPAAAPPSEPEEEVGNRIAPLTAPQLRP